MELAVRGPLALDATHGLGGCPAYAVRIGGQAFTGGWVDMSYPDEPDRPFVYPGGSMTKRDRMDGRWWVWPLPPPGRLDFICRLGEAETRLSIDAQPILDASHRSTQAWPAEPGINENNQ
jgi:hypothetical protein